MGIFGQLVVCTMLILYNSKVTLAIDPVCDYRQYLDTGVQYTFKNYGSPNSYPAGSDCLWWVQGNTNTRITLQCTINLPQTQNCAGDKFRVSLNGDGQYFSDARNYCGYQTISLISNQNTLAVEMYSTYYSTGGAFSCTIKAVQNPTPTPTPAPSCDCGWKQATRIVGGDPTGKHEFPSMAALTDRVLKEVVCGAVILNQLYVLTAAHCTRAIQLEDMGILVGDWNISSGVDVDTAALYRTSNFWEHPQFDSNTQINDLAIVRAEKPMLFSLYVGPICLPFAFQYESFVSQTVTLLGWGQTFFNGPSSNILLKANVQVTDNTYCKSMLPNNLITEKQICTYAQGKDACQHDSGGPVLWQNPTTNRLYVVGIISYGLGCATNRPAVNTRVTSYLDWIVNVVQDAGICVK